MNILRLILLSLLLTFGGLWGAAMAAPAEADAAPASLYSLAPATLSLGLGVTGLDQLPLLLEQLRAAHGGQPEVSAALDTLQRYAHRGWRPLSTDWSAIGADPARGLAFFSKLSQPEQSARFLLAVTDREQALMTLISHLKAAGAEVERQGQLITVSVGARFYRFDCRSPRGWLQCDLGLFDETPGERWAGLREDVGGLWFSAHRSPESQPLFERFFRGGPFAMLDPTAIEGELRGETFRLSLTAGPLGATQLQLLSPSETVSAGISGLGVGSDSFVKLSVDAQRLFSLFGAMISAQVPPPMQSLWRAASAALSGDFWLTSDGDLFSPVLIVGLEGRAQGKQLLAELGAFARQRRVPFEFQSSAGAGSYPVLHIKLPAFALKIPYQISDDALVFALSEQSLRARKETSRGSVAPSLSRRGVSGLQLDLGRGLARQAAQLFSLFDLQENEELPLLLRDQRLLQAALLVADLLSYYQLPLTSTLQVEGKRLELKVISRHLPYPTAREAH